MLVEFRFFTKFFRDRDRSVLVPESVSKKLAWDLSKSPHTYKQIYDYIDEKERPKDVLVIDNISELSAAKKFLDYHPADVVFAANIGSPSFLDEDYCLRIIDSCAEDGITLYEFRKMQELNSYPSHVTVGDIYRADHESVKKLRKTL